MGPTVSVVSNYNYGKYIAATVESVLRQTYPVLEVLIVDNGSTDDSRERIAALDDKRLRKIFQENQGQAGARNSGLREAKGELIAFLDADDIWLPEKLAKQVPLFSRAEVGLVYCGMKTVGSNLEDIDAPTLLPKYRGKILQKFAEDVYAPVYGGESTAVARASVIRRVGEFEKSLSIGTGWDMWRRISSHCEVDFCEDALVLYRQHGSNLSRRLDVYSRDTELKLARMFSDPSSKDAWPLRGKAYGVHRMSLAIAHLRGLSPGRALYWALRAVASDPCSAKVPLAWPLKALRRKFV